jgi:SHS2 domain-containing protein
MKRYEQFPHTADIGVRVFGKDLKELFENAAFAMFDIIADLEGMTGETTETFKVEAADPEGLLVAWLDELLYIFYTKQLIFYKFNIEKLEEGSLRASVVGRPIAANRNRLKTEIKAATYSDLKIKKSAEGYSVEVIFDV